MSTSTTSEVTSSSDAQPRSQNRRSHSSEPHPDLVPRRLDPQRLPDHIDRLYRAAWALCGSREDAEDLVQETFVNVLKRPRLLRDSNEIA